VRQFWEYRQELGNREQRGRWGSILSSDDTWRRCHLLDTPRNDNGTLWKGEFPWHHYIIRVGVAFACRQRLVRYRTLKSIPAVSFYFFITWLLQNLKLHVWLALYFYWNDID
jgi:hypothetical protein